MGCSLPPLRLSTGRVTSSWKMKRPRRVAVSSVVSAKAEIVKATNSLDRLKSRPSAVMKVAVP